MRDSREVEERESNTGCMTYIRYSYNIGSRIVLSAVFT